MVEVMQGSGFNFQHHLKKRKISNIVYVKNVWDVIFTFRKSINGES
jgi:hypothetical protein